MFTGITFLPPACLYLEENSAHLYFLRRNGFFGKEEVFQEFRTEGFEDLLEGIRQFLTDVHPSKLTVILNSSFFLERTVIFPFRRRQTIAQVLPGELQSLLTAPVSEYLYDFIVPEEPHLPVTVFLLPLNIYQSLASALQPASFRIIPSDLVLGFHPAVAGADNALVLTRSGRQAQLVVYQKNKFALGRTFYYTEENYAHRSLEEKQILLRTGRFSDMEPVEIVPDQKMVTALSSVRQPFNLKTAAKESFFQEKPFLIYFTAFSLVLLWFLFFVSAKAKSSAQLSQQNISRQLQEQRVLTKVGGASLELLLSDRTASLLLQEKLSPLETFSCFNDAVPKDLPLVLDSLQIDRQKLSLTGTLNSPAQVDRLVKGLSDSGVFDEVVLGEMKVEAGSVRFPLTAKIAEKQMQNYSQAK